MINEVFLTTRKCLLTTPSKILWKTTVINLKTQAATGAVTVVVVTMIVEKSAVTSE